MGRRLTAGLEASASALLVVPAAAQAEDFRVTNLNDDGAGSLRTALEEANGDTAADRILFKSKLSGEISLQDGLFIDEPVTVTGPGARRVTVDANDDRLLVVSDAGDTSISGLRLTNGHARPLSSNGGAITVATTDLTLSRVQLAGNQADNSGGAVGSFNSSLTIENSTLSGNDAANTAGAIYAFNSDVSIRSSTISGNDAENFGGATYFAGDGAPYPEIEILNSTVTANSASYGGGLYDLSMPGPHEVRGSIVAGNDGALGADDLDDGTWAAAFSIVGDTGGATIDDNGGNLLNVDPKLKPLRNNGGPTDTHAFKKSPAKNKGPSDAPNSDQRGAPRKGKADIGAYELTKCKGVIVNRVGTAGKDKLKGTKKKDGILGLGGNDKLSGKKGKDGLCGGSGKDKLKGGPGKDKLSGGPGRDKEVQ